MVLWLVLTLGVVLAVLSFSFHLSVRQRNAQAHAVHFGEVALGLARSGIGLGLREVRRQAGDPTSHLRREAARESARGLEGRPLPLDLQLSLLHLSEGLGSDLHVEVRATLRDCHSLESRLEGLTPDPLEQDCLLELRSRGNFRGIQRQVRETRRIRFQLQQLPVLGRFTLFVRRPESSSGGAPGYNRFANDIDGAIDLLGLPPRENRLPLVLYNHGGPYPALTHDLERSGWVYLGGREPVRLNLTSGADYQYGQYFHFYNFLEASRARQAAFLAEDPPPFFREDHTVHGESHRYYLKHVLYGFFTRDRGEPVADLNRDGVLGLSMARDPNARSGTLHLFGSTLAPSPTRVFGPVYQSFPIYTGITVDRDGDGRRDGVLGLLPEIGEADFPRLATSHPLPEVVRDLGRPGEWVRLDPAVTRWEALFPDYESYRDMMSTVIRQEPYNASLDYLLSPGHFPPETAALDPDEDYPNPGDAVTIPLRAGPGETPGVHFEGDLGEVDGEFLEDRVLLEVPDAARFRESFLRGGVLELGVPTRILEGDLELPPDLWVERGGLLVVEGDIRFDGIRCAPGERLLLVSRNGDLLSPLDRSSPGHPLEADLVALAGTLVSQEARHSLNLRGTLALGRLDPDHLPAGGQVLYSRERDPARSERGEALRIHLSERAEGWGP